MFLCTHFRLHFAHSHLCLEGLLDSPIASIALTERGDWTPIQRHPNFRLFAAMNPPTDFGKKALLPAMRNRFSELHVAEMTDPRDLSLIVGQHLQELPQAKCPTKEVVDFYLECRKLAGETLVDGQGRAPRFSLRTLSRSLSFARLLLRGQYPLNQAMFVPESTVESMTHDSSHVATFSCGSLFACLSCLGMKGFV